MTIDLYATSLLCRSRSSHSRNTTLSPAHTCSAVTSGFFPPQPSCLLGHETHHEQAQSQVSHQGRVVLPLEVLQPYLLLAQPNRVLHVPAAEAHSDQQRHTGIPRRVADEI